MTTVSKTYDELAEENERLRERLEEAEATVEAIRRGEVDAVVVYTSPVEQIYTLEGADRPYRLLVEAMQQPVATLSREGIILYCNPCFAQLLKTPQEKVTGSAVESFLVDADRPVWADMLLRARTATSECQLYLRQGDGGSFPAVLRLAPLPFKGALCLLVTDLTQQRQYEELKRADEMLKAADRRKDEFLATLAHELRNPLAPIRNAAQILNARGSREPELVLCRAVIDRQVRQMTRLLEDLLDVSRVSRNRLELRKECVELASVMNLALETSRPVVDAGRHHLTVNLPPEPIWLEADPVRLAQVFSNLLNNAAKYTEEGGRIRLTAERQGGDLIVSVKDSGIGITTDMLPHVFEIFSQAKRALERAQGGLGIGLSLVKGLVELHGGSIKVESDGPGKGSEFIVRLPIGETRAPQTPLASEDSEQTGATKCRLLIVDDLKDSADSLAMLLKIAGHEVYTAYDGEQAVAAAERFRPEVVLLDIGMPKLNGDEACRRIRELPWGKGMFLIALTGWGQEADRLRT
jgi:PAS domain S-box-containing protein